MKKDDPIAGNVGFSGQVPDLFKPALEGMTMNGEHV